MAKAIAICTCKKCGNKFKKEHTNLKSRDDANSWSEWVKTNIKYCPDCERKIFREKQEQEAKENGLDMITMKYRIYKEYFSKCPQVTNSYNKENKTITVYLNDEQKIKYNEITNR